MTPNQPTDSDAEARQRITALLLAGGRGTRMGGVDKGQVGFRGRTLAAGICAAIAPQVAQIIINANRNLESYGELGHAVIEDQMAGHLGPLAGMHAGFAAARQPWLLTIPCDGPFVRPDYAAAMLRAALAQGVKLAVAHDGQRYQPVYCLIHRDLAASLAAFLAAGERKIDRWHSQHDFARVDFSAHPDMFTNINTAAQLAALEQQTAP